MGGLDEGCNRDECTEVFFYTAPDSKYGYIDSRENYKHAVVQLWDTAFDNHTIDIGSGALGADICESNQKQR